MDEADQSDGVPMTPQEREALQTAVEQGYYDVPRRITTTALAEEVGVSDRELSELLRHATVKLVHHSHWDTQQSDAAAQERYD